MSQGWGYWFVFSLLVFCAINFGGSGADFESFLLPSVEGGRGWSDKFPPGLKQVCLVSWRNVFTVNPCMLHWWLKATP